MSMYLIDKTRTNEWDVMLSTVRDKKYNQPIITVIDAASFQPIAQMTHACIGLKENEALVDNTQNYDFIDFIKRYHIGVQSPASTDIKYPSFDFTEMFQANEKLKAIFSDKKGESENV